jgi:hypothetical protein
MSWKISMVPCPWWEWSGRRYNNIATYLKIRLSLTYQ